MVLFLEEHLAALGESYPVSYEGHAQVLEALSAYRPRVVFVDFAFLDQRSGQDIGRLNEAICGLQESGTAVYLAAPPPLRGRAARGQDQWPWSPGRPAVELLRGGHCEDGRRGGRQRRADLQQRLLRLARSGPALPPVRVDAGLRHVRAGTRPRRGTARPRRHAADGDHLGQPGLGAEPEVDGLHERASDRSAVSTHASQESARRKAQVPAHEHDLRASPAGTGRHGRPGRDRGQGGLLRRQLPDGGGPRHLAGLRRPAGRVPARDGLRQPGDLRRRLQASRSRRSLAVERGQRPPLALHGAAAAPGGQAPGVDQGAAEPGSPA